MTRNGTRQGLFAAASTAALLVGLATGPAPLAAGTSSGNLDTGYGTSGFEDLGTAGGVAEEVVGLAAQGDLTAVDRSDFRVYLAQVGGQIVVGRLGANGQPDTGSEWNGNWAHDGTAGGIGVDDDDRIYVRGDFEDASGDVFATVARLLADGSLDTSYGSQGFADLGNGGGIAVSSDGEVHIVGTASSKGKTRWAAWRLDGNGGQDTSFGRRGVWTSSFEVANQAGTGPDGVRLDSAGNVLIFGGGPQSFSFDDIIVRLDSGGSLDTAFGAPPAAGGGGKGKGGGGGGDEGGIVTLPSALVSAYDVVIGASDDIYVSGSVNLNPVTQPSDWEPYVMHLDADGRVDSGFGNGTGDLDGVAYHPARAGTQGGFHMVIAQSRIVVTGAVVDSTTDHDVQLFAVDLNGDAVTTFGPTGDGLSEAGDTGDIDHAYHITIDAAGDLLVAGETYLSADQSDSHLLFARYCW